MILKFSSGGISVAKTDDIEVASVYIKSRIKKHPPLLDRKEESR